MKKKNNLSIHPIKLAVRSCPPDRAQKGRRRAAALKLEQAKAEQLSALEAKAFLWIARGRSANIELGRVFLQIKDIVGHGRWEHYYGERFGSCGIAKRTAQTYMDLARKEDASKTAESALFPPAMDTQAVKTRDVTAKAEAEVGDVPRPNPNPVRLKVIFELPLLMSVDDQTAAKELLSSPNWASAQQEIITFLKQLYIKFGIVDEEAK